MALEMPRAKDLFGDVSAKSAAEMMEDYTSALSESLNKSVAMPGQGSSTTSAIEALVANKSLAPDVLSSLNTALSAQRGAMGDVVKDISLTSPLSSSFAAFDLEAPAKLLTPRPTPLRNKIPRKKGVGTAHRIKRVLGYTGTGTGGVGNTWPGITETTTTSFGSIAYERGPKISYAADDLILPYNSFSLSDSVSFDANFSGLGFQDLRQLSSTSTLYATMLMEERMMLMSRGTATGFVGALAAPTVTLSAVTATGSQVALTNGTTYYVYATSDAGAFGESVLSTVQSQAITTGQVVKIVVNNVAGALGTKIYVGTSTGAANAHYVGRITSLTGFINGAGASSLGDNVVFNTTGTLASTITGDTSAYATGYDGIIPTLLSSAGGAINEINSAFSTANPGVEYQNVFATLYDAVKADPDEVLINGSDRRQLSDAIKSGSTANYRLAIESPGEGGITYGSIVTGLQNEVTGKAVGLTVHPWLPQGVSPVMSYTLPIPDTQVSDCWSNYLVQDYMGISWPVNQFSYDFSTYFRGVFMAQAPAWSGIVSGIVSA
jgi:hypothetical protein